MNYRNASGMTYAEWLSTAGRKHTRETYVAWQRDEDPEKFGRPAPLTVTIEKAIDDAREDRATLARDRYGDS